MRPSRRWFGEQLCIVTLVVVCLVSLLFRPKIAFAEDGGVDATAPSSADATPVEPDAAVAEPRATRDATLPSDATVGGQDTASRSDVVVRVAADPRGLALDADIPSAPSDAGAAFGIAAHVDGGARDASAGHGGGTPPRAERARPSLGQVARVALGLCALLALVLLAGHSRVASLERKSGLSMFASTGVPFLLVGAVAAHPAIGVLTPPVIADLRPALEFGLGWIGLRIGSEFDVREFDRLPQGTSRLLGAETGLAFVLAGGATALALAAFGGTSNATLLRDAAILGACASVSAPTGARLLEIRGLLVRREAKMLRRVTRLDDSFALIALAVVNAAFYPANGAAVRSYLPPLGWVFLQIGMGATLGFVLYAFRSTARGELEENALTFGAVAFAAGMAGYLGFSPLVVAFVAGVVVTNVTQGRGPGAFGAQLVSLERPIFVTFFTVVGASLSFGSDRAWLLIPLFVLTRLVGKSLGVRLSFTAGAVLASRESRRDPASGERSTQKDSLYPPSMTATDSQSGELLSVSDPRLAIVAMTPSSAVAVAIVTSARTQYPDLAPFVLTVVIVSGALAELVTQLEVARALQRRAKEAGAQQKEQS